MVNNKLFFMLFVFGFLYSISVVHAIFVSVCSRDPFDIKLKKRDGTYKVFENTQLVFGFPGDFVSIEAWRNGKLFVSTIVFWSVSVHNMVDTGTGTEKIEKIF